MGGKRGILEFLHKERLGMKPAISFLVHTVKQSHVQTQTSNELEMHWSIDQWQFSAWSFITACLDGKKETKHSFFYVHLFYLNSV